MGNHTVDCKFCGEELSGVSGCYIQADADECPHNEPVGPVTANDVQVGGDHYRSAYQHWDFIENNGLGYLEAAATKYVTRWRQKNGLPDLEKALHYTDKLIELHKAGRRLPRGFAPLGDVLRFARVNGLDATEESVVHQLSRWCQACDLSTARIDILKLIDEVKSAQQDV